MISIGLEQQLRYNILLPVLIGIVVIILATLIPLNNSENKWENTTYDYIYDSTLGTTQTRIIYVQKYINEYFDVTKNNMDTIHDYIESSVNGKLNVQHNYKNYFAVSTIDTSVPAKDTKNFYFSSSSFVKNVNNPHDLSLVNSYSLNGSTIYDNVIRATFKSSDIYTTMYFGFEVNGLYRRYPFADLSSFVTFTDTCYYNNQPITTYDPRCRVWYVTAKYDDTIHYTAPYKSALTGQTRITASRRVMNGTQLLGVFGIDFVMKDIDDIVVNNKIMSSGYMFMMNTDGVLISYPELDRSKSPPPTVFTTESYINANVWNNILNDENNDPTYSVATKNGNEWIIVYVYLPSVQYYIVMMYPESDVEKAKDDIFVTVNKNTTNGNIVLPIIAIIVICIATLIINSIGKKYTEPIRQLVNDMRQIGTVDLDIELGNRAPVSAEFTTLNSNFSNLLTAVKFGNDAYYGGNMQKSLESYKNAEKLMVTLNVPKGLSVCYNNEANVYKQMGEFAEAERLYLKSIKIIVDLMKSETDNTTILAYKVLLSKKIMNLGVLYKDTGRLTEALNKLNESLDLARETDNAIGISKISGNLAQLYLEHGHKIQEARDLIYDSYDTIKDRGDEISLQYAMMNIGIYEKHVKNNECALSWFTNVLKNFEQVDIYVKQVCLENVYNLLVLLRRNVEAELIKKETQTATCPNDVLFVLDCSGSMAGQFITTCKTSIKNIIVNNLQDNDNISMIVFNGNVTNVFTDQTKQNLHNITNAIDNIRADGGTAFYDALFNAVTRSVTNQNKTKWIVALTDGEDNRSERTYGEVINHINKLSVNIVIITVGKLKNDDVIKKICKSANKNGKGVFIEVDKNADEINKVFSKVAKLIIGQLNVESL